jgi:beta-RFAP synthase
MISFGHADRPQFGGVGVMVEPPAVGVRISPATNFEASGTLPDRTRQVVERCAASWMLNRMPSCRIEVHSPASHTGLGVGTQVGLSIAAGLRRFLQLPELSNVELALSTGRGQRSAVGTHGFHHGGLIVDAGKDTGEQLGKLAARVPLPDEWRFVLFCSREEQGLSGTNEAVAFNQLPQVPEEITKRLWAVTNEKMLPAAERGDCSAFGEAVYQFGRLAGECFSAVQGGPFASEEVELIVESIRKFGVSGVGQSSWGPTVFAVVPSKNEARQLAEYLEMQRSGGRFEVVVARVNNSGARIEERSLGD